MARSIIEFTAGAGRYTGSTVYAPGVWHAIGLYMNRATGDIALAKNVKCGNSGSGVFVAHDGSYGITKTISFMDYGGDIHHFTFKGGILTGHHLT